MFSGHKSTKEDTRKLIQTITSRLANSHCARRTSTKYSRRCGPTLEATIKSLALAQPARTVKRNTEDMVGEILELVRAEANRTQPEIRRMEPKIATETHQVVTLIGITVEQYEP